MDAAWATKQCAVPGAGTAEGSGEETEEEEPRLDDDAAAQVELEADFASTVPTPSSLPADYDDRIRVINFGIMKTTTPCSPSLRSSKRLPMNPITNSFPTELCSIG